MLTNGLDGCHTAEGWFALPPDEPVLEIERAFVGFDNAADRIVAHRDNAMSDTEPPGDDRANVR
jgi:hypothetical protein